MGVVWTGFGEDGGGATDHGGDGNMNRGDNICWESSDHRLEDGRSSFTMESGIVAYNGRVWGGGEAGGVALVAYPWGGCRCSQPGVGWTLRGKSPARCRQR